MKHSLFPFSEAVRLFVVTVAVLSAQEVSADEQVFSGPQAGEKLTPFSVRGVFDEVAGKDIDFVTQADGKPILLVFVHDMNRQSLGLTRVLSQYTVTRAKDGLATGIVWLSDDPTEAENTLKRVRHGLAAKAPIGISLDGLEGPGTYGLNRKVMLTILVGKDNKVTANFALVQPSLQADLPKILESVTAVVGGPVPKLEDLEGMQPMARNPPARPAAGKNPASDEALNLRPVIVPVINRNATPEAVDKAAKALEEFVADNEAARKEVGRIANTIIDAGKLENYGTPRAQEYLQKWAKAYGPPAAEKKEETPRKKDGGR